jgi:hypothetical protein
LFCPNCKLEYRAGFTRCADCDVDLIAALPKAAEAQEVGVHDLRTPIVLRRGVSVPDAAVIREALKVARIRFNTRRASAEIVADGTPSYEFWINAEDRPNAQSVLESALEAADSSEPPANGESADATLASLPASSAKASTNGADGDDDDNDHDDDDSDSKDGLAGEDEELGDLDDDELTAEAWSGRTGDLAGMLKMCLREVGILSRASKNGSNERLLVAEQDLARSKEIIREVIEATPPE